MLQYLLFPGMINDHMAVLLFEFALSGVILCLKAGYLAVLDDSQFCGAIITKIQIHNEALCSQKKQRQDQNRLSPDVPIETQPQLAFLSSCFKVKQRTIYDILYTYSDM